MIEMPSFRHLSDAELLAAIKRIAAQERQDTALFVACLAEVERRDLHGKEAYPSLFAFCVGALGCSEDAAYRRVCVSRAASRCLELYSMISDGSLSLSAAALLAPHLTKENGADLLTRAQGKNRRQIETLIAALAPRPDIPDRLRFLPLAAQAGAEPLSTEAAPPPVERIGAVPFPSAPERILPSAPQRVQFSFTGSSELLRHIERAREILRHKHPAGRLEDILSEVAADFLERHDPDRRAASPERPPRLKESRKIPQWVKDRVWARDGGRCAYAAASGRRCPARDRLEFDHRTPWSMGGRSDDPGNIRLLCRAHNQLAAREIFGELPLLGFDNDESSTCQGPGP